MQSSDASGGGRLHSRMHQHHHPQTVESRTFRPRSQEARDSRAAEAGVEAPQPSTPDHRNPDDMTDIPINNLRSGASRDKRHRQSGPRGRRTYGVKPQSSRLSSKPFRNSDSSPSNPAENVDDKGGSLEADLKPQEEERELQSREVDAEVGDVSLRLAELQANDREPELDDEQLTLNDQQQKDEVFFHLILNAFIDCYLTY